MVIEILSTRIIEAEGVTSRHVDLIIGQGETVYLWSRAGLPAEGDLREVLEAKEAELLAMAQGAGAEALNLETFRAWALEQVNHRSDLATAKAGIIVRQFDMVARYSANAFEVLDWIALGRPSDPDPLLFPAAAEEAAAYADTSRPGFTMAEMLAEWEIRWRAMRVYDQFRGHRRRAIERIRVAESVEAIAEALAGLPWEG